MQWIKTEREREREREQLYRFLPQTGSSHVLLALRREFTKNVISDYKCSMLQLARDFKLLKHNCKRFPMLLNTVKRLPMLKHNCITLSFYFEVHSQTKDSFTYLSYFPSCLKELFSSFLEQISQ